MKYSFKKVSALSLGIAIALTAVVMPVTEVSAQQATVTQRDVEALVTASEALDQETCIWIKDTVRPQAVNNSYEVVKVQSFLKYFEGFNNLAVTGQYNEATIQAVRAFQAKYASEILSPWGYTTPTGVVHITTRKKINEIFCGKVFPLTANEQLEISNFRNMRSVAVTPDYSAEPQEPEEEEEEVVVPEDEEEEVLTPEEDEDGDGEVEDITEGLIEDEDGQEILDGVTESLSSLGAAVTTFPQTGAEIAKCIFYLIIRLAIIYIVVSIMVGSQDETELTLHETRTKKLLYFAIGGVLAAILSLVLGIYCVVIPLIVIVIILSITLLFFTRSGDHNNE